MCGHRFCRHCITPFRDCPVCGADCQPLSDDADMQGGHKKTAHCMLAAAVAAAAIPAWWSGCAKQHPEAPDRAAETVDKYIAVHSRDHKLTSGGKAAPQAEVSGFPVPRNLPHHVHCGNCC